MTRTIGLAIGGIVVLAMPASYASEEDEEAEALAALEDEVIEVESSRKPGSDHDVSAEELERYERDDIHHVLAAVPGVYFREEDGFGLRPNIGMRGSNPERSAKVALMEDGILIAPAPYAAPAAYYFPLVTRMQSVEVLKGPGSVIYGPNTVGGSINMISQDLTGPHGQSGYIDVAGGQTLYGKLHGRYSITSENLGLLIEGVRLRSNGFKDLDGGGNTGFDKTDLMLKGLLASDPSATAYHKLKLTLGYADEVSNETYTGLSRGDFDTTPYRRYAATALDRMEWDHLRWLLSHSVEYGLAFDITTTIYRNSFDRSWRKLDGFRGEPNLANILSNPDAGNNPIYYGILTGTNDTTGTAEELILGTNARTFVSQGIQSTFHSEGAVWPGRHDFKAGIRFHYDSVERDRTEESFAMAGGTLVPSTADTQNTVDSLAAARALSLFAEDRIEVGIVSLTAGSRVEIIHNEFEDYLMDSSFSDTYGVWIPGIGAFVQPLPWLGVLAGVHKGFVPVAPSADTGTKPEESFNYEVGARLSHRAVSAEVIGFFNDYSNLKGTCTISSGCDPGQVGTEFNGGRVHTWGIESLVRTSPQLTKDLQVPMRISSTMTRATFQGSFSSTNPQWGDVESGDRLPYLPSLQIAAEAALRGTSFEVALAWRWQSSMLNTAAQDPIPTEEEVPSYSVLDLAANYDFGTWGRAYLTLDNVLDSHYLVSYRPFGARPGKPRLAIVGYKNSF